MLEPTSAMSLEEALGFMMSDSIQATPLRERKAALRLKGVDERIIDAVMFAVQTPIAAPGEPPPSSNMNVEQAVAYLSSSEASSAPCGAHRLPAQEQGRG